MAKWTNEYSVAFIDTWEIADEDWEPPCWRLSIFDSNDLGYDVRDFEHYPSEEEVQASLSQYRKDHR